MTNPTSTRLDRHPVVILVTDSRVTRERTCALVRVASLAVGGRRLLVQLRDKDNGPVAIRDAARALRAVTREVNAWFVVNGATSIAYDVGADGVHLPADRGDTLGTRIAAARRLLGEDAFVTAAVHDDDDVRAATASGVTGILVSPIFTTPGKGTARGVEAITTARSIVSMDLRPSRPLIYALGGVDGSNAKSCAQAGADGVAVIRALYDADLDAIATTARALAAPFQI